jgi:hypothetical protein
MFFYCKISEVENEYVIVRDFKIGHDYLFYEPDTAAAAATQATKLIRRDEQLPAPKIDSGLQNTNNKLCLLFSLLDFERSGLVTAAYLF